MDYTATTQALAICIAENSPVVLWGKPGQGKALDVSTPIPTPLGWTRMGDLQVGDQVFDEHGVATTVTAVYPQPLGRECFSLRFDEGSEIIADKEHQWEVMDGAGKPFITTTHEIFVAVSRGKKLYIPVAGSLQTSPISTRTEPTVRGMEIAKNAKTNSEARLPTKGLRASEAQRIALLRGLLHTSGDVNTARDRVYFESRSARLVKDVFELLASLGFKPYYSGGGGLSRVEFHSRLPLFRDKRKDKQSLNTPDHDIVRTITRVERVRSVPVQCITVDSPSSLYLAGRAMIPTHNTSVIQGICKSYGFHLETVIASIREPSDFAGLPYFENGMTRLAAPSWVHAVHAAARGDKEAGIAPKIPMVFYDEISTAPPAVQAALLRPILENVVGDTRLPDQTRSVAAANPPGIAADGWDFSPPAANRFTHLDWELDHTVVKEGFTVGWPRIKIPALPKAEIRRRYLSYAKSLVGTFLGSNPKLVAQMPDNFSGMASRGTDFRATSYAFPSPRSWETAARLYATVLCARFPDGEQTRKSVAHLLLNGTVGVVATREFLSFAENMDLPDPTKLLANPQSFEMPARGDQLEVVLTSVLKEYTARFAAAPNKQAWLAWGDILVKIVSEGKGDIAYMHMIRWNQMRPEGALPTKAQAAALKKLLGELSPTPKR